MRGHPVEERGLGDRAGGRQQAVDGPLDPIGEGRRRGRRSSRVGQPPAARLDLGQAPLGRAAELVADQREQALDRVRRGVAIRGATACPGRGVAAPSSAVVGVPSACAGVGSGRRRGLGCGGRRPDPRGRRARVVGRGRSPAPGRSVAVANRRSCPARSSPTRISPRSRSKRAGSPRARSVSTAASRHRSGPPPPPRTAGRRTAPAARTGGATGPCPGRRPRPAADRARRWRASAAPGGRRPAGGISSTTAGGIVVGVGQPCAEQPVAGGRPAEDGRDDRLRPAVDELDDPAVAGERGSTASRARAIEVAWPAPRDAQRARRRGRRAAGARPPRDRGPTTSRDRRPPGGRGSGASAAGRGRAGSAASAPSGRRRSGRRAGRRTRSGRSGRRRPSPRLRRGCAGPRRGAPGPGRARRRRGAG